MKQNSVETGLINAAAAAWIPPTTTFASPPASPATGSVYIFTDAATAGATTGGGSSLSLCRWSGAAWVAIGGPALTFDLVCAFVGTPTVGATVYILTAAHTINFAANFSGSYGSVGTNPTATAVFTVLNGGTTIGTVSISTSGVFTFATTSGTAKTVVASDRIKITAPSPVDATVADIAFTLAAAL